MAPWLSTDYVATCLHLHFLHCTYSTGGRRGQNSDGASWTDIRSQYGTSYAEEFSVDYYNDGYALITIAEEGQFLVVPEGKEAPKGLSEDITVIKQPLNNIYLVATSAMDLFRAIDGIDNIRLSGTKESGWYIQEAKDAMESGR